MSTELNSLANGSAATSSVGGTSGVFTQTNFANAIWSEIYFTAGGAFTPTAGGFIAGWYLKSPDGGSTYESAISTPSTTVMALPRSPDFIIPFDAVALAANNQKWGQSYFKNPWPTCKVLIQNLTGAALYSSGNLIKAGPVATQY
jgi:hypothetical protein